jgi:hypothetical protein
MATRGLPADARGVVLSEDVVVALADDHYRHRVGLVLSSYADDGNPEEMSDSDDDDESLEPGHVRVAWLTDSELDEEGGLDESEDEDGGVLVDSEELQLRVVDRGAPLAWRHTHTRSFEGVI